MTRGQLMMTVLYRMAGEPETRGQSPFADVKAGQYYTEPIAWAFETGIAKGDDCHRLCPQRATVTRGANRCIPGPVSLLKFAGHGYDQRHRSWDFADAGSVSELCRGAYESWAVEPGWCRGWAMGS
ncbi:MAG: hypothetical protein ACLU9S_19800 [Oscillospiraceae bacterium]